MAPFREEIHGNTSRLETVGRAGERHHGQSPRQGRAGGRHHSTLMGEGATESVWNCFAVSLAGEVVGGHLDWLAFLVPFFAGLGEPSD